MMADVQTIKYFNLVGDEDDIGSEHFKWSRASTFSYNRNTVTIGLAVAWFMALLTPWVALLFALGRLLIVSFAALLTTLILVNRETLVQAHVLPAILSVVSLSMALVQAQSGGVAILR